MRKIRSLKELEVGMIIYLHNTTINRVKKIKITRIWEDRGLFNDLTAITTVDFIDLSNNSEGDFCPRDYNILPNTYNTHFATFDME